MIWNLTGGVNGGRHITDYTNASRTMLFNLENTDWDDGILEKLNIPKAMLPELRPSSDRETYGSTVADGALGGEVPIAGDAGDQQRPCSARPASTSARPRTPTAPATSCSRTPASRSCRPSRGC